MVREGCGSFVGGDISFVVGKNSKIVKKSVAKMASTFYVREACVAIVCSTAHVRAAHWIEFHVRFIRMNFY